MTAITKRHREARGLHADTDTYVLFARLDRKDKELLREAQDRMTAEMGGTPSNPILIGELLRVYLAQAA